jgi:tetraacyldisaccharide 4'-kinase
MRRYLLRVWRSLRFFLLPFSLAYGIAVILRNFFYDVGIFKIKTLPKPVISVGNIVAGGTGKTPIVEWLGRYLASIGKKVAILSRGYGRETKGFVLVTDGEKILTSPGECGDEPFQMALKSIEEKLNWLVAVCEDRFIAGLNVLKNFDIDVFILDDGFQRRDLHRDMNVLVISGSEADELLIPAGLKREPLNSIKRADVIFLRKDVDLKKFESYLAKGNFVRCRFEYKLLEIRKFFDYILLKRPFRGRKIVAFSGIGNHKNFVKTLKDNEFEIVKELEFPDHYRYGIKDIRRIIEVLDSTRAECVVTTEKDYARLYEMKELKNFPFFYARISVELHSGEEELKQKISKLVQ